MPDNSPPSPPPPQVQPTYLPPEVMAVKDAISSYGPPPSGSKIVFVTPPSDETETGPPDPINDFPPFNHKPDSYEPDLIINLPEPFEVTNDDSLIETETEYSPPKDLFNFPPNVDSKYYPPGMVVAKNQINSYIPPPSGNKDEALPPSDYPTEAYKAPKNLHNFPPNIDSSYNPQQARNPDVQISSYLPPPSGNKEPYNLPKKYSPPKNLHNFPPNIDSEYLPPEMRNPQKQISSYLPPPSGNQNGQPSVSSYNPGPLKYIPPKSLFSFPPNVDATYLPPELRNPLNPVTSYLPPPSGSVEDNQSSMPNFVGQESYQYGPPPTADEHDHHHHHHPEEPPADDHDHHHHHHPEEPPSVPPSGPPDMIPSGPPSDDHHHHHHQYDDAPPTGYSGLYGHDASPELIYDFDHDHHDFHHHDEPIAVTTAAPEPEEPRVKKYSYYYLGRKLWYIPLYFTLWFCLYVAALIFRSIGRHKVIT